MAIESGAGWRVARVCVLAGRGGWGYGATRRAGAALRFVAGPGWWLAGWSNLLRAGPGVAGVWAGVDVWGWEVMRGVSLTYHRAACRVMPYSVQRAI